MATEKHLFIRWATLKGVTAIILFLIVATLAEYVIVLYAINLGVKDEALLQWSFEFPGIDWTFALVISPLFHLVPLAAIISLVTSWSCLTKYTAVKTIETQKGKVEITAKYRQRRKFKTLRKSFGKIKSGLLKVRGVAYVWQKVHFARATIKSAVTVLLVFLTLAFVASLLAYPNLIHDTVTGAYKNDPSLLNFVSDTLQFLAPIGGVFSGINDALRAAAPIVQNVAFSLGLLIKPLADSDNAGKYIFFQNAAAWVSALATLFYGEYRRQYRYKKTRRSQK